MNRDETESGDDGYSLSRIIQQLLSDPKIVHEFSSDLLEMVRIFDNGDVDIVQDVLSQVILLDANLRDRVYDAALRFESTNSTGDTIVRENETVPHRPVSDTDDEEFRSFIRKILERLATEGTG